MGCCNRCNCTPCSCSPTINCPDVCSALTVTNSWNVPDCGGSAVLYIPNLKNVLIGTFLSNPTYGYFQITGFNSLNYQVTVINNCYVENAAPGTVVPAYTKFLQSPTAGTSVTSSWTPVVTATGAMTVSALTIDVADYWTVGILEFFMVGIRFTLGGVADAQVNITLPTASVFSGNANTNFICQALQNGVAMTNGGSYRFTTNSPIGSIIVIPTSTVNWTLGALAAINIEGFYRRV